MCKLIRGKKYKGGGATTTQTPTVPGWARGGLKTSFNDAGSNSILNRGLDPNTQLALGSNSIIDQSQQAALAAAQGQQNTVAGQQSLYNQLSNFGSSQDPALQAQLAQVAQLGNRNLQENIMPGLRTNSVMAGQAGSSRQGIAEGIAARGTAESIGSQQTQLLANANQNRLASLQAAGGLGGNLLQQQMAPSNTMNAVGMQQRDIQTQANQNQLLQQQAELQRLQGIGNLRNQAVAPFIGLTGATKTSGGGGSALQGAAGGAMAGAAFGPWGALAGGVLGAATA